MGRSKGSRGTAAIAGLALISSSAVWSQQVAVADEAVPATISSLPDSESDDGVESAPASEEPAAIAATLPMFTPLKVMLDDELSSTANKVGDRFGVTVLEDVVAEGTIVIPAGTRGEGVVSFATPRGGFGKAGMLSISLRTLDLGGKSVLLDGRYREEGKDKNGAVAATYWAVGIFAGFIKGKPGHIERGRELRARTGEDIVFIAGHDAPSPLDEDTDDTVLAASSVEEIEGGTGIPAGDTGAATEAAQALPTTSIEG